MLEVIVSIIWCLRIVCVPYLDDVSSKGAPKPLLFGVVELIVGQIPWIFDLWLGHILKQRGKKVHLTSPVHISSSLLFYITSLSLSHLLRFILDDACLS